MVDSTGSLVKALSDSRLLTASQRDELVQQLQHRFPETKALARALLDQAWLTPYQVNQLLLGNGKNLELGQYIILERLGDNALGQVFKARHHFMNRAVRLTLVREELLLQPNAVEQFYHEIQAASQLSDPHIVHAYDAGPSGRTHFFAMEFVDGTDLDRLVQQLGRLSVNVATIFIQQIAQGLHHAYGHGLLHHDLRPASVWVGRIAGLNTSISITSPTPVPSVEQLKEAVLKIANLGLTVLQPGPRNATGATTATFEGSWDYVAPEQAQLGKVADVRSNLYSAGCIFYFLLAGRPPFAGSNSSLKLRQHEADEPPTLDSFRTDVSPKVAGIIRTLMAKRPEDRYQTPGELLAALAPPAPVPVTAAMPAAVMPVFVPSATQTAQAAGTSSASRSRHESSTSPWPVGFWTPGRLAVLAAGGVALIGSIWLLAAVLSSNDNPSEETGRQGGSAAVATFLPRYIRKGTREETIFATLQANGLPTFEGKWFYIGPFDNKDKTGFAAAYPPEKEIELTKTYTGKDGASVGWKELPGFRPGKVFDFKQNKVINKDWSVIYLYHDVEVAEPVSLGLSLGSDDTLTAWLNGKQLVRKEIYRAAAPDQELLTIDLKPGKNHFLAKVCQGTGSWAFYICPRWPDTLEKQFGGSLRRDFPAVPTPTSKAK